MKRWIVIAFLLVTGCPDTTAITDRCVHAGDPCRLPSGPLGICSESTPCASPPCLACTSQH